MTKRRVAVTGLGVVSSAGIGCDNFWNGLLSDPPSGERRIENFRAEDYFTNPKEARRTDRFTHFALAAAGQAMEQAGDLGVDPFRIGVLVGTGVGGIATTETQVHTYHEKGPRRVSPFLVPMSMPNAAAAAISMRYGTRGPCETTVTACASGTHSLGNAARLIQHGVCDAVIAGSSEAGMSPVGMQGFLNMTAFSTEGISRPFDKDRDGFVISEGAGILILELWDHAVARGANILAEFLGSASTADAHHITAPAPGGSGAIAAMQSALADSNITPDDVTYINAHGTSTPMNDANEATAISKVFTGQKQPAVTSIKGITGHSLGAAGAIEAVSVVLSFHHQAIPPTHGFVTQDPELPVLDIVTESPRAWNPGIAISNSFGFGGHNGTLVLSPHVTKL